MPHSSGTVIESQVDWLTVSAHGRDAASNMLDLARGLAKEEASRGNRKRSWRLMGYEGYHVGRIEYGQRDRESTILRLIGDPANGCLGVALSLADQVTRLDIAATYRADPPDPNLGQEAYHAALAFHEEHPGSALISRISDSAGGSTTYIGRRQSDSFFRLYNKEAECRALNDEAGYERYRSCWRFELEAKAALAKRLAEVVADREDRADYIRGYLMSFVEAHGIEAGFLADQPVALLPGFRRRSDAESRLRHLARNVAPTVKWLGENGHADDALRALGLA